MIWHGLGAGFAERTGSDFRMAYDLELQRPPHSSRSWFNRRMNSKHWRPMPFGAEGEFLFPAHPHGRV